MPYRNNFEQQRASVDLNVMFAIISICYKDVCAAVEYFMFTFLFIFTPHNLTLPSLWKAFLDSLLT